MDRLKIEMLDREFKLKLFGMLEEEKRRKHACRFIDCRVWIGEGKGAYLEQRMVKGVSEDYGGAFNVRVLAGDPMTAPGYEGAIFGAGDFPQLISLIRTSIDKAYEAARASSVAKERARDKFGPLGESLWSTELALPYERQMVEESVPAQYRIDPRNISLPVLISTLQEGAAVASEFSRIAYQVLLSNAMMIRELIVGTGGACIDQTFAITESMLVFVGQEGNTAQEHMDVFAHQRGWEIMEEGVDEKFTKFPPFIQSVRNFAQELSALCIAPPCPTVRNAVVVTEPHYNTLVSHEIVGHPVELDRVLKMETAYAGRSWLLTGLNNHMVGQQVASPLVSAYSDPNLPGYGYYKYDHEGVRGKRVVHIENGVLRGFMSSSQTASIFGGESNGHWRASEGDKVPLIRMSNTVFAPGEHSPQEIIRGVGHGYFIKGHAIPSISESRENFRILARSVYEIRNGEIGELYRDGGIMADSREYLMNVDAVGRDFQLYPIPHCGKGSPMQTKKLGNGGPTMRSRATLVGPTQEVGR